jgi:RNA polymerase sigma-70 factor (ECF subfamily)
MPDDPLRPSKVDPSADDRGDPESTRELIDRARQGDQEAVEQLFSHDTFGRSSVGRPAPRWARDFAGPDDLVQDALLQTFKRIGDFEPRHVGALQAYLRQAVVNRLRDELRRKGRRPDETDLDEMTLTAGGGTPLEAAIGREAVELYERALQQLKPEEREIIVARLEMDYTYEELAQVLGKPTAEAARKAAQRALVKLAEAMKRVGARRVD